jgi:hypothetical protein
MSFLAPASRRHSLFLSLGHRGQHVHSLLLPAMITTTGRPCLANAGQRDAAKRQLARRFRSLYVLTSPLSNRAFETSRYGRSDRHHRKIQSGERRPLRRGFSVRSRPRSRAPRVAQAANAQLPNNEFNLGYPTKLWATLTRCLTNTENLSSRVTRLRFHNKTMDLNRLMPAWRLRPQLQRSG